MPIRSLLPAILKGQELAEVSPESIDRLEALADQAASESELIFVRDECAARLKQPRASLGVQYLLAATCSRLGEIERAHQTLLTLGEKLQADREWEALAAVAEHALDLQSTQAAARLLATAHEGLGRDPARIEALRRAWQILPEDLEMGLLLAIRLGDAGLGDERRRLLAQLLPRFAAEGRTAGLEEAALEFTEHQDTDGLLRLVDTLPEIARQGSADASLDLLATAFPPIAAAGRAGEALGSLRRLATECHAQGGEPQLRGLRAPIVTALEQGPARALPQAEAVLEESGVKDPLRPLLPALQRFDVIAALPPGRGVLHPSFGPGRVLGNDGEMLALDFLKSRGHRMPYAAAMRSLVPIGEEDPRLMRLTRPEELQRILSEDHGEALVRALRALNGSADAEKLKVFFVGGGLVSAAEWTALFRKLRAAAEKDPRVDHARAFEKHYQLAAERAGAEPDETPLPGLEPRKPARTNLATIRKFLAQHPQAEAALARRFGKFVERTMHDVEADKTDRARAGVHFSRWFPEQGGQWTRVLRALWEQGLAISDLSGEDEQLALLERSHAGGVEADAILSALDSRFATVREAAEKHREALDENGRAVLLAALVDHATRYPAAALRHLEQELSRAAGPEPGWGLLGAALALIEDRPKPSLAEKVLAWISPGGAFDRLLAGHPCPEPLRLRFMVLLRQWRSSDRFLFPALEAVERLGLSEVVATVREGRRKQTEKLFDQVGRQADVDLPVMTRATWNRLKQELGRLERELRTTIPATIQKARELGDLKENAEYHSAKLKQANVSKQVAALQRRLTQARFVEDAELKDGVAGLGTEVVLESDQDLVTYWILGEGEQHHGEQVISFQSQIGRMLVGRGIGDEIEISDGRDTRRYRVVSVEPKLPPHEQTTS